MQSQEVNNLTQINIYTEKAVDDSCVSFYHYTHARLIYRAYMCMMKLVHINKYTKN